MPARNSLIPKPRSETLRPELTRLPVLGFGRRVLRTVLRWLARAVVAIWTRPRIQGLENLPKSGAALLVANHLGDADVIIGLAHAPVRTEPVAKMELRAFPFLGWLMQLYGVIWIHRGLPDRRALQAILQGLSEGRLIAIAPEGRESLTGALEEGTHGAAYLAIKACVPVLPVTFTGSENQRIYGNLLRFRRTEVSMNIGQPFFLENLPDRRQALERGTDKIMRALAAQLPEEYRGFYNAG